ncbi:MAG: hypothetical protein ACTSP6_01595 [Promethearchaeota archaeon]
MTNITFSVDDDLHKKMKQHPEIKWTEILRQSIMNYLKKVEEMDVISIGNFRKRLNPDLIKKIKKLDEEEEISFYKEAKKMEQERLNHLKELERSTEK